MMQYHSNKDNNKYNWITAQPYCRQTMTQTPSTIAQTPPTPPTSAISLGINKYSWILNLEHSEERKLQLFILQSSLSRFHSKNIYLEESQNNK